MFGNSRLIDNNLLSRHDRLRGSSRWCDLSNCLCDHFLDVSSLLLSDIDPIESFEYCVSEPLSDTFLSLITFDPHLNYYLYGVHSIFPECLPGYHGLISLIL